MNNPVLIGTAFAFIIGILVARYTNVPFFLFWTISSLTLILSVILLKSKAKFFLFLAFSVLFLGAAVFRNSQNLPPGHISNIVAYRCNNVCVEGIVDSDPAVKTKFTTFAFKTERLTKGDRSVNVCGKVLVRVAGERRLYYGDRLIVEGNIYRAPYFRISKRLNYRDYLRNLGMHSILNVSKDSAIKLLHRGGGNPLKRLAFYMRQRMKRIISDNISPLSGSILNAIILGERSNLSDSLKKTLVQSGTIHIIAISGLHVGLVSFIVLMVLRMLGIPPRLSYAVAALIVIMYCLLTGSRPPVVRVTIMALILFFGYIIDRQTSIYNALSLAALSLLLYNPYQLFNVSFQLSFISIISIAWLSPRIKNLLVRKFFPTLQTADKPRANRLPGGFKRTFPRILISLFSGSLAAWIGILPLNAYYFNIISPVALLANMAVVPYLSIIVGSGILTVLIGFISPPLTYIFSATNEVLIVSLVKFVSLLVQIPGAYFYLPAISFSLVIWYYLLIISTNILIK